MSRKAMAAELQKLWNLCDQRQLDRYNNGHRMTLYGRLWKGTAKP